MITSLFGPLGAPGPLGLFAPDLNRLYQRHWGLEGSRKAKKWRRHTPDCSSQLTTHSLSPLWVSREAKAAIQAPSPLWYKKIAQIQASTGPEINYLTKPRPIPAFPPMGLGGSTKKRGFCDNFFRVKIVWAPLTNRLCALSQPRGNDSKECRTRLEKNLYIKTLNDDQARLPAASPGLKPIGKNRHQHDRPQLIG